MIVDYQREGVIGVITIDNPPVNATSQGVRAGLMDALAALHADAGAQAAVILCAGRTWVAGADITEFGKPPMTPHLPDVIDLIEASGKPVVAAIHGTALGGGLEIALGAHARIATPDARLGLPEVTLGLMPGAGGTQRLPRLIGLAASLDIITSARQVGAAEALKIGLVDRLATGDLTRTAMELARELAGQQPRRTSEIPAPTVDAALVDSIKARLAATAPGQVARPRAVDAMIEGLALPFDQGMAQERAKFMELMDTPQRAALIHAFFAERAVTNLPDLKGVPARAIDRIGVIGGGTMGAGIAVSALLADLDVTLVERDAEAAERAAAGVDRMLEGSVRRGKLTSDRRDAILSESFRAVGDYEALSDADLIVEAVFEKMEVKEQVFAGLDAVARPGAVLATNTSYLDVNRIAQATGRPQDVIGLHFFSPAHVMRLLEVVVADRTAPDVVATGFALARKLKKIAVRAGVCDGFIGNRILAHYRAAADAMVLDGASPYQIDRALTEFGFAMGPYAVSDLAGLDIGYLTRQRMAAERHPRDRVPVFADRLFQLGRLGRKSGRGYYIYDDKDPKGREDPELAGLLDQVRADLGIVPRDFDDAEIVARYMAAMVNEGARVIGDGIAARPLDVDVVLLNGYGFPRWRGGPMHWADAQGLPCIAADIERFARQDDHFWHLAPLLRDLAAKGGRFGDLNQRSVV
ncbi:enoyl-CoA hydratase/isomerase family protein [Paracoccus sp. R12_1]|uniref:3-hydroxyacyl-CoA dehydrogenase NAD-binding domain-containing protein n=1 Tax=unclassified Paracoccus (in: a-proteobacteria) TaxID=2688777 RepID=UPI001AD9A177|nr:MULTISPECIES: 3-hydroxyacyl-CoA dehydrogenase NAD-binding domain-containing protein [unclassified Paracoccus (in: a-proteobacteria)]MBO9456703.1 enoyl-CoA hydratase/isomerase family protein [Paracoccus sp. R12_2]MBO9487799.1 enoyl-CoA hydratase/isomerase family protein [Paracoccus sp. R12_1]